MHYFDPLVVYALPLLVALGLYLRRQRRRESAAADVLREATEAGLTEPPSLHPVVDPARCVGAAACMKACPEQAVGVVRGRGHLVEPTICIGHGACAASCPVEAITLVFGTERRGIDIPYVKPTFETNVPGVYIAGELGGMGLVRKAAEQGRQAVDSIAKAARPGGPLDLIIVGAGPAGLSATLAAMDHGLSFVTVEQESSLGGTVYHYPRRKVVMTQPFTLPIVGKVRFTEVSKEALLEFWEGIVDRVGMEIRFGERVESIEKRGDEFSVQTTRGEHQAPRLLLTIGRRGTPRRLGVPGEDAPKVVYRLIDPEQYRGLDVLVVGGGDSALEAAIALASETDTTVTLSYRGEAFGRARRKNRERVEELDRSGAIRIALRSRVESIGSDTVVLDHEGRCVELANDAVVVCVGGVLPTGMLRDLGIEVQTKHGEA